MKPKLNFLKWLAIVYGILVLSFTLPVLWHHNTKAFTEPIVWILPFLFALAGIGISWIIHWLKESTKSIIPYYLTGGSIVITLFLTLIIYFTFSTSAPAPVDYRNINESFLYNEAATNSADKRFAFRTLTDTCPNPKEILLLEANTLAVRDTQINGLADSVLSFRFLYTRNDKKDIYKANVEVFGNKARVLLFDQYLSYREIEIRDSIRHAVIQEFKKTWKELPDSTKKQIEKELPVPLSDLN